MRGITAGLSAAVDADGGSQLKLLATAAENARRPPVRTEVERVTITHLFENALADATTTSAQAVQ